MKKRSLKCFFTVLMVSLLCLCLGCQPKEPETDNTQDYFEYEAVTEIQEGRPDVYVILKVLTSQYWQDIVAGITDAGNELGCNIYIGSTTVESDWQTQQLLLEEAKNAGADAIILAPGNSSMLSDTVKALHDTGTPIILVDTILNDTSSFDTCYMTDNIQAGELAAEEMLRLLKENGISEQEPASIAIQITSSSSQTVIDRLAGFNQYWSANAPENWIVLDEVRQNNGDIELAGQNCIELLETYPDIKGVFGCNNSSTVGFVKGLMQAKRNDVILVGFDYADETAQLVASDEWAASAVVQSQYDMGYQGLTDAFYLLNGNPIDYKFVDTGTRVINQENHVEYERSLTGDPK